MTDLLNAFRAARTLRNACAIRAYERQHPMVVCTLSDSDFAMMKIAIAVANAKL